MTPVEYLQSKVIQEVKKDQSIDNFLLLQDAQVIFTLLALRIKDQILFFSEEISIANYIPQHNSAKLLIEETYKKFFPIEKAKLKKIKNLKFRARGHFYFQEKIAVPNNHVEVLFKTILDNYTSTCKYFNIDFEEQKVLINSQEINFPVFLSRSEFERYIVKYTGNFIHIREGILKILGKAFSFSSGYRDHLWTIKNIESVR
jgi:hypothetical protein